MKNKIKKQIKIEKTSAGTISTEANKIVYDLIKSKIKNKGGLESFKRKVAKKYKIACPTNAALLKTYHKLAANKTISASTIIEYLLRTRPVRSLSGIINVSLLIKPYPCPGKCIFCPSQKGVPKSYLKKEPAVQRATSSGFNPYAQIQTRLKTLMETGHPISKIELRIIGGTWSYYPKKYQTWFVKECFRACNKFSSQEAKRKQSKKSARKSTGAKELAKELKKQQKKNENGKCRVIGMAIETRPDCINAEEIKNMRKLGVTKVELGVQTIYDDVLKINKRGHTIQAVIEATKLLKNAGLKVSYQMMPNLLGSCFKKDVEMFKELFKNPNFRPDFLKIYPLALLKQTAIYVSYLKGEFKPYTKKELIKLLIEIKKIIPPYCRIQRIIRDIPSENIVSGGVKTSNLREIVQKEMQKIGLKCRCIRCREVRENYNLREKIYFFRKDYNSSGGREIFLSFETKNKEKLYSLLRLRIPLGQKDKAPKNILFPALKEAAMIREIHSYGQMIPVDAHSSQKISPQHRGLGKKLIKEAEKIASKEFYLKKIAVISGIGARQYYRKLGYKLKDTYMVKILR